MGFTCPYGFSAVAAMGQDGGPPRQVTWDRGEGFVSFGSKWASGGWKSWICSSEMQAGTSQPAQVSRAAFEGTKRRAKA
jgi:hypothetical protein